MSPLRRRAVPYLLLGPGLIWLALFFVVPLYFMGRISLQEGSVVEGFRFAWNFSNYADAISQFQPQLLRSLLYASIATTLAFLIAYPLAYVIAFRAGRWKNALLFVVIAPFFTTYLIRTLAWLTILDDSSPAVGALDAIGLLGADGRILQTPIAVIAGITYNFLPFMILPLYASLERIDRRLIEAAQDLYASTRQAFMRVTLPLSAPGIVAGTLLTFIPSAGDFVNARLLGTPREYMIGNVIESRYLVVEDYQTAAALSFVLLGTILIMVTAYLRFAGSESLMGSEAR